MENLIKLKKRRQFFLMGQPGLFLFIFGLF